MLSLPPIHGSFPVGVTTFVTPVRPPRPIGKAKLKNPDNSRPSPPAHALQLEEVAFAVYYPADTSNKPSKGIDWLLRPLSDSLLGFATYLRISTWLLWPAIYLFGSLLKIPATLNAPLLHPEKAHGFREKQWPLVIFSHGLLGTRTTYSHYCSRLAASGKVVLALEHRDGSGLACRPRSWGTNRKRAHRIISYIGDADVYWEDGDEPKDQSKPWRNEQLTFRCNEIDIMYETFRKFTKKDLNVELESIDGKQLNKASWTSLTTAGSSIIKCNEDVALIGHSFGGATSFSLLATEPNSNYTRIPVSKAILLDPWMHPLPRPVPVPHVTSGTALAEKQLILDGEVTIANDDTSLPHPLDRHPRMFVINSEASTLWESHFTLLQETMAVWEPQGRRIATLIGSTHMAFSDFHVLPIFRKKRDILILDNIIGLSLAFLEERIDDALKGEIPTTAMNIQVTNKPGPDNKPQRILVGEVGHVVVI